MSPSWGPFFFDSWSPSGEHIAVAEHDHRATHLMGPDGSNQRFLGRTKRRPRVIWSPDGTRAVIDSMVAMNVDGTDRVKLGEGTPTGWSSDGRHIASSAGSVNPDNAFASRFICVVDADGTNQIHVGEGFPWFNSFEPGGSRFLFNECGDENSCVDVINVDGSEHVRLATVDFGGVPGPQWSPDGTQILYSRRPDDNNRIHLMNADGSNQWLLARGRSPRWSPDGSKIAYIFLEFIPQPRSERYFVHVVDRSGSNDVVVSEGRYFSWAPDGSMIAVHLVDPGSDAEYIAVMAPDGSKKTIIAEGNAPAWSPFLQ